MDKAVTDTHCLLGSRLRDPDSDRQGCIVGIDQTRETPALLVRWNEAGVERVALTVTELSDLVAASLAYERNARGDQVASRRYAPRARASHQQASGAEDAALPDESSSKSTGYGAYRPLATGSDGRR